LLGSAVFLVLVIGGFIGTARYVRHRLKNALMTKLGVTIDNGSINVAYSHTEQGRTIYTLHAATEKPVPGSNGVIALHDVSIVLYGKKGDRSDRIYGDDFEYDRNSGVVRAKGLVHIDLQAAGGKGATASPAGAAPDAGKDSGKPDAAAGGRVLHVTTSSLVYMEKLGVAATGEYIEFQVGGMKGHATGADYASDSGLLMLHSAVSMEGIEAGRPVKLTAGSAEFDNRNQETFLTQAKYESQGRTAEAEQATLHTRADGTLSRVEAQGNATAESDGATMVSQGADVMLNAASEPQSALLTGGVKFARDRPLQQVKGQADEAAIAFDGQKKPQPQHAVFTGAVHITERTRKTEVVKEPWSTRDLTAAKVDAVLAPAGPGHSQLKDAEATGNPHLTLVNNGSLAKTGGQGTMELTADDLKAHMILATDTKEPPQLDTIAGRGHTVLHQTNAKGMEQITTGDTLDAKFRPQAAGNGTRVRPAEAAHDTSYAKVNPAGSTANEQAADLLMSAVQQGHFTLMRRVPAKAGNKAGTKEDVQHAVAQRAAYDGDLDRMTLTGGVQVMDAGSVLWANQVVLDDKTGGSEAVGAVKVDYVQDNSTRNPTHDGGTVMNGAPSATPGEPMHILADRAERNNETDIATFHGKPVRMWQGASQIEAPVIELASKQNWLLARGETSTGSSAAQQGAQVHTVLARENAGAGTAGAGKSASPSPGCANPTAKRGASNSGAAAQTANAVRIASGGLRFSGILNQADFTGGFRADSADGTIRANTGTAYLKRDGATQTPTYPTPASKDSPPWTPVAGEAVMNGAAPAVPSLGRLELDRVVAAGRVDIQQPAFRATGERLVYTAGDQVFLLTGDSKTPPRATDAKGTTTTAAALRFHNPCDDNGDVTVEALSAVPGEPAQRVQTDTRVGNAERKEKEKR
jgi:lipopolysaccharide export system protein LptA